VKGESLIENSRVVISPDDHGMSWIRSESEALSGLRYTSRLAT